MGELSTSPPSVVDSDLAELLSPSQVRCFMDCQVRWWFKYGLKYPDPPTGKMVLGRAVHAALTQNFAQKLDTYEDLPVPASWRYFGILGLPKRNRRNSEMTKTHRNSPDVGKAPGIEKTAGFLPSLAREGSGKNGELPAQFVLSGENRA